MARNVKVATYTGPAWDRFVAIRMKTMHDPACRKSLRYTERRRKGSSFPRTTITASAACLRTIEATKFAGYSKTHRKARRKARKARRS